MQQQRILAIVTIHTFSIKIILKQKYAGGGYFLKSTTLRPGGPAGPPGSEHIVGISKRPGIGEKIRGDNKIFSNVREKYHSSPRGPTGPWAQGR